MSDEVEELELSRPLDNLFRSEDDGDTATVPEITGGGDGGTGETLSEQHPEVPNPIEVDTSGDLDLMVTEIRRVLETRNEPPTIFRTMREFSRVGLDDHGTPVIVKHTFSSLAGWLAGNAVWHKTFNNGAVRPVNPPSSAVSAVRDTADLCQYVPVLERVATMPLFAVSGDLVSQPGYHRESRVWLQPPRGLQLPQVSSLPSMTDVMAAKALIIDDLLGDFPFQEDADRAAALALLFLPFVREMVEGPTPLHLVSAPTAGTGKGLLGKVCLIPSHSELPAATTLPGNDEEMRKLLSGNFMMGYSTTWFDNVSRNVDSGTLAQAIAEPIWRDRKLGGNEILTVRVRCQWLMTGNNVRLSGELVRRAAAHCRLNLAVTQVTNDIVQHPERRDGFRHPDLVEWALANQVRLAHAALTLIRSWIAAGQKAWSGKPLGTFESWSRVLGGILEHLGVPGFLGNVDRAYEALGVDEDADVDFLEMWWKHHGNVKVKTIDLITVNALCHDYFGIEGRTTRGVSTAIGSKLGGLRDRVIEGYVVSKHGRLWQLSQREDGPNVQPNNLANLPG